MQKHCCKVKKGYILIYVLLIGTLLLYISTNLIILEIIKDNNTKIYSSENTISFNKEREIFLTELNKIVEKNCGNSSREEVKGYFSANKIQFSLLKGAEELNLKKTDLDSSSYLKYEEYSDNFYLYIKKNKNYYKIEEYSYDFKDNKLYLKLVKETYNRGDINN